MFPYSRTSGCIKQHSEKCVFLRDFSRSRDRAFLPQRSHQAHSRRVPAISRKFVSSCPQGLNQLGIQCPPHASIDIVIACPKTPYSAEKTPDDFWIKIPPSSLAVFLLGVFFIFGTLGSAVDTMGMGLQPIARYLVSIVLFGVFAIFYATCGLMLRGRYLR